MAKSTRIKLTPDDPIFSSGPQVFVPISRPSTNDSKPEQEPSINPMAKGAEALERTAAASIAATVQKLKAQNKSEESTTPKDQENL